MLEIIDLNFAYPNGAGCLKNVNLSLKKGEILTVLGKNGAGKSTMLGLMSGALKPNSGKVMLNGRNVLDMSNKERAKFMAYVAQSEVCEYEYSALEYITMGRAAHLGIFAKPAKEDYETAKKYIQMLGIGHLESKFITQMSGGEKQMSSIARALTAEPELIIFDEPTSALDFGNQYKFLKMAKWLLEKGYTIILTTHNPDFAILLGGVVALVKNGGEVECGSVNEIIKSENLSRLYDTALDVSFVESVKRNCCLTYPL